MSFLFAVFYITMGFEQMCTHFYDYCYVKANVIDFIVATDVVVDVDDDDDGCYAWISRLFAFIQPLSKVIFCFE